MPEFSTVKALDAVRIGIEPVMQADVTGSRAKQFPKVSKQFHNSITSFANTVTNTQSNQHSASMNRSHLYTTDSEDDQTIEKRHKQN
jgi:hypothetical protein